MTKDKNDQKVCSSCFFTDSFPGIAIDENGRCNYCNEGDFSSKISELTSSDIEQLRIIALQIKEESQKKERKYDCIIGGSGGLDSSYVIYIAKKIMDLNPLVVSYVNDFTRCLAKDNLKQLCRSLNVDLRIIESKKKFDRKHIRSFMRAFKDVGSYWGCCEFCGYILDAVIYKFASEENISIMLGSNNLFENKATQYLSKKFKSNYMIGKIRKLGFMKLVKFLFNLSIAQYYFVKFKMEFSAPSRMKAFFHRSTLFSLASGKPLNMLKNMKSINVTEYIPWDIDEIVKTLAEFGWKAPEKPDLPMRFDCVLEDALIDYTYKSATGLTIHSIMCNNLIFGGVRTKDELADTVNKYEEEVFKANIQLKNDLKI